MTIDKLVSELFKLGIGGISSDTRDLKNGDLFVCLKGDQHYGGNYVSEAIELGAKAILSEEAITTCVPNFTLPNIHNHLGLLLSKFYDYPYRELEMIGITGTDGKTSTATFIEYLLNQKHKCCYIGTNGIRYLTEDLKTRYTTVPLCSLYKTLRYIANQNIRYVSMEVSSQGLVNKRCDNVEFDVAIFTNLSPEHLDTHKTMEQYFQAKCELFEKVDAKGIVIVNGDDPYSKRINHPNKVTFGLSEDCNYRAIHIKTTPKFMKFDLLTPNKLYKGLRINRKELFNLYNAMAATIVALHYHIDNATLYKALETLPKVKGRLELLTTNENFKVYVDFAHTPNALQSVIESLKEMDSRLILVMGAAGGKDKLKRPLMGKIACDLCDFVYFTAEDPRNEDPITIIQELKKDVTSTNHVIIPSREDAIQTAIKNHQSGDIILITGKGNDDYFEAGGIVYEYSDISVVLQCLEKLKSKNEI